MSDSFDWRIIDRHLAGESSSDDEASLAAWLASDPRNASLLNDARAVGGALGSSADATWNVDHAWSRVAARMHEQPAGDIIPLRARAFPRARTFARTQRIVAGAAVVIAAAGVVAVVLQRQAMRPSEAQRPLRQHEVVAAVAQQTRVTLGDGTQVVLNAGSRLRYADDFGRGTRDVELDGEGYFDVVHDESRPFRVHARGSVAQDVGTRFVVRAYPEQHGVDVVVTDGAVSLLRRGESAVPALVAAGQRGRIDSTGAITVAAESDLDRWTEWTRGGIVLEGMTLGDAALELGRRFGVYVEIRGDEFARRRVSARFHDEPLPRVLDALAVALGGHWTRDGQRVVFSRVD
ncbi:MAG TPA: FecR domain-containing protein [Gemmatimonadaceae bacterium]|nr:FecR domain-containing protein [Gemmatimonadaceae bacterium]